MRQKAEVGAIDALALQFGDSAFELFRIIENATASRLAVRVARVIFRR